MVRPSAVSPFVALVSGPGEIDPPGARLSGFAIPNRFRQDHGVNVQQRALLGLTVAVAGLGLVMEADYFIGMMLARGVAWPEAVIRFFSYFTVLTNAFIAAYGLVCLAGGERRSGALAAHASLTTWLAVSIFFVSADYTVLLRPLLHLTGMAAYANNILHYVVPALFLVYWIMFASRQLVPWVHACWWTLYPVAYFISALAQGGLTGFYPYPFINVTEIGYRQALLHGGTLLVLYWLGGLMFIGMTRLRLSTEGAASSQDAAAEFQSIANP